MANKEQTNPTSESVTCHLCGKGEMKTYFVIDYRDGGGNRVLCRQCYMANIIERRSNMAKNKQMELRYKLMTERIVLRRYETMTEQARVDIECMKTELSTLVNIGNGNCKNNSTD